MTTSLKIEDTQPVDDQDQQCVVIQIGQKSSFLTQFDTQNSNIDNIQLHVFDYEETSFLMKKTQKYIFEYSTSKNITLIKQQRTNHDLDWLKQTIKTKYPGIGLPVYKLPNSQLNIVKQKCIIAEMFLKRLANHPILKYSPQVQIFFLEKIQFLEKKKEIEKSRIQFKGLSTWSISSLISHLQRLTLNKIQPNKQSNWSTQFKNLLDVQKQLDQTIYCLKQYSNNLKNQYIQDDQLIKKQCLLFSHNRNIIQFQKLVSQIRNTANQVTQKKKTMLYENYINIQLIANIVMQNLVQYKDTFKRMVNLQISVDSNAYSNKYQQLVASQNYLQLLMNNLEIDTKDWLEYNSMLINKIQ